MKFKIPKEPGLKHMNSITNGSLMTILFDDTELDRMFALLFERCVKKGEIGPARKQKEFAPGGDLNLEEKLIPELSKKIALVGFDSERGREILKNWSSTSRTAASSSSTWRLIPASVVILRPSGRNGPPSSRSGWRRGGRPSARRCRLRILSRLNPSGRRASRGSGEGLH
jgi:hypothetical protein